MLANAWTATAGAQRSSSSWRRGRKKVGVIDNHRLLGDDGRPGRHVSVNDGRTLEKGPASRIAPILPSSPILPIAEVIPSPLHSEGRCRLRLSQPPARGFTSAAKGAGDGEGTQGGEGAQWLPVAGRFGHGDSTEQRAHGCPDARLPPQAREYPDHHPRPRRAGPLQGRAGQGG